MSIFVVFYFECLLLNSFIPKKTCQKTKKTCQIIFKKYEKIRKKMKKIMEDGEQNKKQWRMEDKIDMKKIMT